MRLNIYLHNLYEKRYIFSRITHIVMPNFVPKVRKIKRTRKRKRVHSTTLPTPVGNRPDCIIYVLYVCMYYLCMYVYFSRTFVSVLFFIFLFQNECIDIVSPDKKTHTDDFHIHTYLSRTYLYFL